jgi:hypothetical protein
VYFVRVLVVTHTYIGMEEVVARLQLLPSVHAVEFLMPRTSGFNHASLTGYDVVRWMDGSVSHTPSLGRSSHVLPWPKDACCNTFSFVIECPASAAAGEKLMPVVTWPAAGVHARWDAARAEYTGSPLRGKWVTSGQGCAVLTAEWIPCACAAAVPGE